MDICKLTLSEASWLIRNNELTPTELLNSLLKHIDALETTLKAWVTIDRVGAEKTAKRYSKEASKGKIRGPLHGIPIGIKDIFFTKGLKTAAGSAILAKFVPGYDATTVAKLKQNGAIILGKTETTEFAYRDPPPTRNPWNTEHTPGGSSSGSAAAVASGMCPAALGSQTGGSTIRPAAYCGIVGLKPTYGRISRHGVYPLSWTLDHVGIFTRTVNDAAIVLEALAGYDPKDATSATLLVPAYEKALDESNPPKLGLVKEFFYDQAHDEVRQNLENTIDRLLEAGAQVVETRLPRSFSAVHAAHSIIMTTEAAAIHEETFQMQRRDYRIGMRSMITAGLLIPAHIYLKAQRIRSKFIRAMRRSLKQFDCLITPAATMPAPKSLESTGDPAFNSPWSFCGFPSITVPSGLAKGRLPLGIQLVGRSFDEQSLLNIARWCENVIGFEYAPQLAS
jgi:Asp-tRNA(Asn)/Glu-tRNA(Gln) amidotransferase A subunit family amidase